MQYPVIKFDTGQVIFKEGEAGDCLYIVKSGTVEIYKEIGGVRMPLASIGEGGVFGEMALFTEDHKRTASVKAASSVELVEVKSAGFKEILSGCPAIVNAIAKALVLRLKDTTAESVRKESRYIELTDKFIEMSDITSMLDIKESKLIKKLSKLPLDAIALKRQYLDDVKNLI